jgi:hypothetical protein
VIAAGRSFAAAAIVALAAATAAAEQASKPSITIILTDHHFRLTAPVDGGPLAWRVRNEGTEPHQALVVKLPERVSEFAERAWLDHGRKGPEPGERVGGVESVAPGKDATFETDLKPGKYLLLCTMSEEEGRHYDLGMIYRFEIE